MFKHISFEMAKFKLILITLHLIIPSLLFSQKLLENNVFVKTLEKKTKEFSTEHNFNKAQSFFIKKNWDSTLVNSMKQLHSSNNKELADYCHYFRGSSFREKKLFEEAISELNLVSKNFGFYSLINKDLGENFLELKQYKKAISYFKEVEKIPNHKHQGFKISIIYQNLGICYLHLKQFSKAEEYLFKSLKIQEKEKDILSLIGLYSNIATLFYDQYKDKQAIMYFEKGYYLSKKQTILMQKEKPPKTWQLSKKIAAISNKP